MRSVPNGELGIDVYYFTDGKALTITDIKSAGAIAAWNKQCIGGPREVHAGDRIISVNSYTEAPAMLAECKTKLLLKMIVQPARPKTTTT